MLGGMVTVFASAAGFSLPVAALIAVGVTIAVGLMLYWLRSSRRAARPLSRSSLSPSVLRFFCAARRRFCSTSSFTNCRRFPAIHRWIFRCFAPSAELWVLGGTALIVVALYVFLELTGSGKSDACHGG